MCKSSFCKLHTSALWRKKHSDMMIKVQTDIAIVYGEREREACGVKSMTF